jgi:hypothetical protein
MMSTMKGDFRQQHARHGGGGGAENREARRHQAKVHEAAAQHAEGAVEHEQEHHGGDGGRNDERQCHHGAHQAIAAPVGIEQQGDQHAEHELKDERHARVDQCVEQRIPDALIAKKLAPVEARRELQLAGHRVLALQGEPDCIEKRIDAEHDHQGARRHQPGQWMFGGEPARQPGTARRERRRSIRHASSSHWPFGLKLL